MASIEQKIRNKLVGAQIKEVNGAVVWAVDGGYSSRSDACRGQSGAGQGREKRREEKLFHRGGKWESTK
jgi:hypothetical protein